MNWLDRWVESRILKLSRRMFDDRVVALSTQVNENEEKIKRALEHIDQWSKDVCKEVEGLQVLTAQLGLKMRQRNTGAIKPKSAKKRGKT